MDMDGSRWPSLKGDGYDGWGSWIYDRLAECQDRLLEQCGGQSASVGFVRSLANIYNGTCMILPSAIVSCCKAWGPVVLLWLGYRYIRAGHTRRRMYPFVGTGLQGGRI